MTGIEEHHCIIIIINDSLSPCTSCLMLHDPGFVAPLLKTIVFPKFPPIYKQFPLCPGRNIKLMFRHDFSINLIVARAEESPCSGLAGFYWHKIYIIYALHLSSISLSTMSLHCIDCSALVTWWTWTMNGCMRSVAWSVDTTGPMSHYPSSTPPSHCDHWGSQSTRLIN